MLETTSVIDRPSSAVRRPPIDTHHLTLSCDNRPGIVSAVSTALFESGADITEAQQFDDMASGRFFMRVAFHLTESSRRIDALVDRFLNVAARFDMGWTMHRRAVKPRVLILASRQAHCLIDLLYQTHIGTLPMEVIGIASNHPPESLDAVVPPEIRYHYLPVEPGGKAQQERAILRLCDKTSADPVRLARSGVAASLRTTCQSKCFLANLRGTGFRRRHPTEQPVLWRVWRDKSRSAR